MPNLLDLMPLPYRWLAIVFLCASFGGFCWVKGAQHADAKHDAADALHAKQDTAAQLAATQAARTKETALRDQLDAAAAQRTKENADHETELASLRAAARTGVERLRCPAAALPADTQANDSGAPSRPEPETGRDSLVSGTADDLFRIAASIRQGVRERNALIDTYNAARETCNAPTTP